MDFKPTIICISINDMDNSTFPIRFSQSIERAAWIDWGDNSNRDIFEKPGIIEASHTYAEEGDYEIQFIPVEEATIEFVGIGNEDEGYRDMVTAVTIGEGIASIGQGAFASCTNMETLDFDCETIEFKPYAFANCESLEEVVLPSGMGSLDDGVFFNCIGLKAVTLPQGFSTIYVNAFYGCKKLQTVTGGNLYSIGDYAFHGCKKLKDLMFCVHVNEVGEGAFDSCNNLKNVALNDVTVLGEGAFCNCRSMSGIELPATLKRIGDFAFKNCGFLHTIKMAATEPPILEGSNAFDGADDLTIEVPTSSLRDYARATNWSAYSDCIKGGA